MEWLCFPRFDGLSVFGRLLDDDAGHWPVQPEAAWTATRRSAGRSPAPERTDDDIVLLAARCNPSGYEDVALVGR